MEPAYTPKQGQYLAFIYYYTKIHGVAPAEADLQRYFQTSPPAIHQMVVTLEKRGFIERVSTIHTSHALKVGGSLTSSFLKVFVLTMAVSFIVTTILGVVMAVKYGRNRRAAYYCLAFGVVLPLVFVLLRVLT